MTTCACGCGKETRLEKFRYIYGHNRKGVKLSEDIKEKMSKANSGEKNYWFGKHCSEERKNILRQKNLGRKHTREEKEKMSRSQRGNWRKKGEVGYFVIHHRVKYKFPKSEHPICMLCEINPSKELACITGIYNEELRNWAWFCHKCHIKWDNVIARRNIKLKMVFNQKT